MTQGSVFLTMTIPTLNALAAPADDTVFGQSPPSATLTAYLYPTADPAAVYTQTASASPAGAYTVTFSAPPGVSPADSGYVLYEQDALRRAYTRFVAPMLRAQAGGLAVSGYAAPGRSVSITLTHSNSEPFAWFGGFTDSGGEFSWHCGYRTSDYPAAQPGDIVLAEAGGQTFSMTVMTLTAAADVDRGLVAGSAPAGRPLNALRFAGPLTYGCDNPWLQEPAEQTTVTPTASVYSAALALQPADYGMVIVTAPDGSQTYARFAVPMFSVVLGQRVQYYALKGQIGDTHAALTLTVTGPSGYWKGQLDGWVSDNGYFAGAYSSWQQNVTLDSGDLLTVTTQHGAALSLLLPTLTADADADHDTVSGQAPPYTRLEVRIYDPNYEFLEGGGWSFEHTLIVTAAGDGSYLADFAPLGGFSGFASGSVLATLPSGSRITRSFNVQAICPELPSIVDVGGNSIFSEGYNFCDGVARLFDASGQLKAEQAFYSLYVDFQDAAGRPVAILPGDVLEISANGRSVTLDVPILTVNLEAENNRVTGEAAFSEVELSVFRELNGLSQYYTATVAPGGSYSLTLPAPPLAAGDRVEISAWSGETGFFAHTALPIIQQELGNRMIYGILPPLTPYTLTLQSSSPLTITGHANSNGVWHLFELPAALQAGDRLALEIPGVR